MKCAILCDASADEKKSMWKKLFKKPSLAYFQANEYTIAIVYLPYSASEISALSAKKAAKLSGEVARVLLEENIEYLYLPDWCLEFGKLYNTLSSLFEICNGREILIKTAHIILEKWIKKEGKTPDSFELGIYRRSFDHMANNLLLRIGQNLKYVTLYCDDKSAALIYADNVYMQTGLCTTISDNFLADHRHSSVIMLLDSPPKCNFGEHQTLIDLAECYNSYCINTVLFNCPSKYEPIKHLFDYCDQKFAAFILEASGKSVGVNSDIVEVLNELQLSIKNITFIKRKQKPSK